MKKKSRLYRLLDVLLIITLLSAFVVIAVEPGTAEDPLVTLSYLNGVYTDQVSRRIEERLESYRGSMKDELSRQVQEAENYLKSLYSGGGSASGEAASYSVVTLRKGETLYGEIGTEVLLRVGSATCVAASAPGLVDSTGGTVLNGGGSLAANHLYMMTIAGRGVKAGSDTVKLLVKGSYTIG